MCLQKFKRCLRAALARSRILSMPASMPKEDEKFQISEKFLSEVDWSKIDKEVQRRTIAEKFVLSNSTFTNCSFNISFAGNK